ncbi:MAG: TetR/AcrR family transcriptional regulator [Lachnospiraceae bacterium]|nr:TetR/AcrR family transcriptional regulator [Lachnospiraceae bacterium]
MKKLSETAKKTRKCFLDAFWSLISEKPISKIAVNELTRRTTYNRGTFYEYFLDIDDLVANAESELLDELKQTIQQVMSETDSLSSLFQAVFAAMFGLLQLWNEIGKDLSTEEISSLMQNLVLRGLMAYITPDSFDSKNLSTSISE